MNLHSIYITASPDETLALGEGLAKRLKSGDTVLLFGNLGAGKTQFTKGIARGLGIQLPIKSPTFAYVNHYVFNVSGGSGELHHYDLYRLRQGEDASALGLHDSLMNPTALTVVEWADRLGQNLPLRYIKVELSGRENEHEIRLSFVDGENFNPIKIEEYYAHWFTPANVRAHSLQVAKVAEKIARAYIKAGYIVDLNHLYTAAILHDVARVCDFKNMDKQNFTEEITEEKWAAWEALRRKHSGKSHADIAYDFFMSQKKPLLANLVRSHTSATLVTDPVALEPLENRILFYADKRVKHDQIVSLTERLRDGKERNGRDNDEATRALYDEVGRRILDLERELFVPLDIAPEDIR